MKYFLCWNILTIRECVTERPDGRARRTPDDWQQSVVVQLDCSASAQPGPVCQIHFLCRRRCGCCVLLCCQNNFFSITSAGVQTSTLRSHWRTVLCPTNGRPVRAENVDWMWATRWKGTIWFVVAARCSQSVRAGGRKEGLTDFVPARLLGSQINRERERVRAEY